MQITIVVNMSLDDAMQFAERVEIVSNCHIVSFVDQGNGSILFNLEENEIIDTEKEVSELTYTDIENMEFFDDAYTEYGSDFYWGNEDS